MARFKHYSTFYLFIINSWNCFIVVLFIHILTIDCEGPVLASNYSLATVKTLHRDTNMYVACQMLNNSFVLKTEDCWSVVINYGYRRLSVKSG